MFCDANLINDIQPVLLPGLSERGVVARGQAEHASVARCFLVYTRFHPLSRERLSFLPPNEVIDLYRADYFTMREHMIYREAPDFDEIIEELKGLQSEFRMNE